eukprot:NODE_111_length_19413_cov_0.323703.p4 type:complete len:391 gc:universal NODE_111_length_19413_cov_0.323703:4914-6086(+)
MEVGLKLFTKDTEYSIPPNLTKDGETLPIRVPAKFDSNSLSEMVNHLLQNNQHFDFLVNGQFLRSTLEEYLEQTKTSSEQLLAVEYILSVTKPTLNSQYSTDEWIKSVHFVNGTIFSGSFDGVLRSHGVDSKIVATHEDSNINGICNIDEVVVTSGQNGEIRFWDIEKQALLGIGIGHDSSVESLAVKTRQIASGDWQGKLVIHNLPKKFDNIDNTVQNNKKKRKLGSIKGTQPIMVLKDHIGCISSVQYSRNHLYSGGWDHCVRKYDEEFNLLDTCKFDSVINSLHGEDVIASGHSDGLVRLLDPKSDKIVQTFVKQPNQVSSVQLNNNIIASSCYDGCLRFFDIRNSKSVMYSVQVAKGKKLFDMKWSGSKIAVAGECADIYLIDAPQ